MENGTAYGSDERKEHRIGKDLASIASTHPTGVKVLATEEKKVRYRKIKKLPQGMEMPLEEMVEISGSKKKKRRDD